MLTMKDRVGSLAPICGGTDRETSASQGLKMRGAWVIKKKRPCRTSVQSQDWAIVIMLNSITCRDALRGHYLVKEGYEVRCFSNYAGAKNVNKKRLSVANSLINKITTSIIKHIGKLHLCIRG